jgi:REP element-mobilizing transposase RayT
MKPHAPRGRHSRGYLPHCDFGDKTQSIVFQLDDALPRVLVERWKNELALRPEDDRKRELFNRVERYLDIGLGRCFLGRPEIANLVNESIQHFELDRFLLFAWAIMPNHVHLVLQQNDGFELSDIVHSIKSFTANKANKMLGRTGRFWQPDYFDRLIRDRQHFRNAIEYVEMNPVKAKLCAVKEKWLWSSAYRD